MRVAVISHASVLAANQRVYSELAKYPDVELLLIAPRSWRASTGRLVHFEQAAGAQFSSCPLPVWGSGWISLHLYRGLARPVAEFAPDLVHVEEEAYSLPTWQTLRISRRLGVPLCFCPNQNLIKPYPWPFSTLERRVLQAAALAVPITEECAEVLRAKRFGGRIAVVPYPVDTDLFRPDPQPELRRQMGVRGKAVGYVGRLTEAKGITDLMRAAELLWEAGDLDFSLVFVGDGPLRRRLAAWRDAQPGGRVVLVGSVPHLSAPRYMNALDLLVLPSRTTRGWKEQFGRVLIEAQACGVPVVGSDSGHIPVLSEGTGGGLVFPEGDVQALAQALRRLLSDPDEAARKAERGRQFVLREYAVPRVAEKLHEALSAALS
jgi:glycosyltransferase involved in cell wall biosynthesis